MAVKPLQKRKNLRKAQKSFSFYDLKGLLLKDFNIKLSRIKWFRYLNTIEMKEQPYILSSTINKRELIYKERKAIDTKAFTLNNNYLV